MQASCCRQLRKGKQKCRRQECQRNPVSSLIANIKATLNRIPFSAVKMKGMSVNIITQSHSAKHAMKSMERWHNWMISRQLHVETALCKTSVTHTCTERLPQTDAIRNSGRFGTIFYYIAVNESPQTRAGYRGARYYRNRYIASVLRTTELSRYAAQYRSGRFLFILRTVGPYSWIHLWRKTFSFWQLLLMNPS
jgi:hypothetical protein